MSKITFSCLFAVFGVWTIFNVSCNNSRKPPGTDIAHSPKELVEKTTAHIGNMLHFASDNNGKIDDSLILSEEKPVEFFYQRNHNAAIWSREEQWQPFGDSLFSFIANAKYYGLFPQDYHYQQLSEIRARFSDSDNGKSERKDAALWARADIMLTDAFVQIVKDIKLGRLPQDSITMRPDSVLKDKFYLHQLDLLQEKGSLTEVIESLEPKIKGYYLLKEGLRKFLDKAKDKTYTYVPSPSKDAASYKKALQQRLFEGGFIETDSIAADSVQLSHALKKFQESEGITADGKIGNETLRMLNTSDKEKFVRIAITM
ncbi:MAG TPA: peptidoglycan-binding protein, partial [Chitinophagaceae bacterium]|nr:peptidoglycan-binding protein [Chitinophagaceae bacterium]